MTLDFESDLAKLICDLALSASSYLNQKGLKRTNRYPFKIGDREIRFNTSIMASTNDLVYTLYGDGWTAVYTLKAAPRYGEEDEECDFYGDQTLFEQDCILWKLTFGHEVQ